MRIQVTERIEPGEYTLSPLVPPAPEPEPPPFAWIAYRTSPDGEALPLDGATVAGDIYVTCEVQDPSVVTSVAFTGAHSRTESSHPYALTGDDAGVLRPWDTEALADGSHRIDASIVGAGSLLVSAAFTIDNVPDVGPDPIDPEEPPVEPPVDPDEPPTAAASVERHGITFDFTQAAVLGAYVNGDPAVVGPVTVAQKWPAWNGERHGAMVNPLRVSETSTERQGLDSKLARYSDAYRAKFPLVLQPGQSLLGTSSWRAGEPGAPTDVTATEPDVTRPTLRNAAVLTCVSSLPAPGDFRPPYAGTAKPVYNVSQMIDLDTLPKWPVPSGAPSVATAISRISRLWIWFREKYHVSYMSPSENQPDYGREYGAVLGDAILLLLLDIPISDKRTLAIHLIQKAIDQVAVFETGYVGGRDGGGITGGLHGLIVIGGHLLDEPSIRDYFVGKHVKLTEERSQIGRDELGLYWREDDRATRAAPGKTSYRTCCTTNGYIGHVLAARALGLESSWDHANTFAYADEYMSTPKSLDWHFSCHAWHRALWWETEGGRHAP